MCSARFRRMDYAARLDQRFSAVLSTVLAPALPCQSRTREAVLPLATNRDYSASVPSPQPVPSRIALAPLV